jgi:ribonuclease HI
MLSFGQYRNQSINDVVKKDRQYLEWLNTQPWFKIKNPELHNITKGILVNTIKPLKINKDKFIIYTDGACSNNGSINAKAGIGVHFSELNIIKIPDISCNLVMTKPTNNAAELVAIETAIDKCIETKINIPIVIFTDSDYSIKCITIWYPQWLKNNNLKNKKNINILRRIHDKLPSDIEFIHIRAQHDTKMEDEHSQGNKSADKLAVEGINK